jgi:hypothetical protein
MAAAPWGTAAARAAAVERFRKLRRVDFSGAWSVVGFCISVSPLGLDPEGIVGRRESYV